LPRRTGQWFVILRAVLLVLAAVTVSLTDFPPGYEAWAWVMVGFFFVVTAVTGVLAAIDLDHAARVRARVLSIVLDGMVTIGIIAVFSYQAGEPYRALYLIPIAEAALRFGLLGGVIGGAGMVGATLVIDALGPGIQWRPAAVRVLVGMLAGIVIGRLRDGLMLERRRAVERAAEAEELRDELGRRVDVLEAANRCARALGSSLELEQAFGNFIRELRGLVPFDRTAIVLVEDDAARTIATAGRGAKDVFPPGSLGPLHGSVLEQVLDGQIVVRRDLGSAEYAADESLTRLGLRSELVAPLVLGAHPIGMLTLSRAEVDAFTEEEIELVALLGRLVATAVQNIRAYEAEHSTVEELRRLSELRADFVSLVSHELRSPMAAVIGAARTLQDRWRTLRPDQREAFLALIGDETSRLAALVGDVDLTRLVQDVVDAARFAQPEIDVVASLGPGLPVIRGDRERLRQVLGNLIENAVKYSPEGGTVRLRGASENGVAWIAVSDEGPGIPAGQQARIFEKFGRADIPGGSKPGTGLGLFIARSIAEAHGGSVDVRSGPGGGATFTLRLPVGR
jgi:signal transduction histidine kinase